MPAKRSLLENNTRNLPYIRESFDEALSKLKELDHAMYFFACEDHPMRIAVGRLTRDLQKIHSEFQVKVKRKEPYL
jgi:hypothetical protein